ncbi:TonB-dependent receptor [Novosphingobium mangrovi (ex Huang et al. 2023)]|uniref:TonB-dependent receptor n=1 Tax=Novosphingobium mangrovi (ex Huang et al. 2023) TaxID=2976432 RepID=A0ABT2I0Y0_9SPHN|nr:TonB-dependent receptor [Novosphingobium mangrovi (ex Huang et al. 2023)]MCT2398455.1 TonB-dependent receptor [Novosphingobium mangrovi (ex Huang et al. 2023)]
MHIGRILLAIAMVAPAPALAGTSRVATGPGSAGSAAIEIARQTGSSIVITDPALAARPVPPISGRFDAEEAVRRLARAAGARAVATGPGSWRIERVPARRMAARAPAYAVRANLAGAGDEVAAEPIVVVATKRDLTIDQVAGQVAILDGQTLAAGGVGGTEKIARELATVASTHLGSGRNKLFIRGIADSSFTGPTQATVGQYIGDLRLTYNAPDPDLRLSDMARVEVLEGPQGTLYGAGSLGGIIRLVPNAPQLDVTSFSGMLGGSLTQHGDPGADASATVNLPLAEGTAALRATVDAMRLGGYIDKPLLGRRDVNRTDILGGRVALRVEPAPGWSVDVAVLGQSTDTADSQYADRDGVPLENTARVPESARADYGMGQIVVSGRIGAVHLRSTTGLVRQNLRENYDASLPDGAPRVFTQTNRTRMVANETRLWMPERGGFSWLAGASFTHNRTTLSRLFSSTGLRSATAGVRNTIDEATLYGEASLRLTQPLVATAGGRVTWSRLDGEGEDILPEVLIVYAKSGIAARRTFTTVLPSLALHLEIAPHSAMYMRYQEGFRPGGLAIDSNYVRRFRNDRTQTFEVGARHGSRGRGAFDLAMSLSYTRWQDIQADFIDASGLPSTANIGDGRIWTASLSGGAQVLTGLRLEAGVAWNQSKVDKPSLPVELLQTRAMQVPNIANVAARLGLRWERELRGDLRLQAQGWASYVGRSRLGIGPELGDPQGDYLDTGITARIGTDRIGLTLGMTNIADERGNRFSLGTPFGTGREQVTPLRPRTVRIGIDTRF